MGCIRALAFDGTYIWVTDYNSFNVCKIDISLKSIITTVGVSNNPIDVIFSY